MPRRAATMPTTAGGTRLPDGRSHPSAFAPSTLVLMVPLSVLGAVIGLQVLTTLGVTPNTSLIGVVTAIAVSRVPLAPFRAYRSVHLQNLVQTNISSATFGAANSLLIPVGVPVLLGHPELVPAMLAGAAAGMFIDLAMLYGLFDSRVFPASAPWPHGLAAAEAIIAGDRGGRRGRLLGWSAAGGALLASGIVGMAIPMSAFGVAFIGSAWALGMFAAGLLVASYLPSVWGFDLQVRYIPHGFMIGAGLAALTQALAVVSGRRHRTAAGARLPTRPDSTVGSTLLLGFAAYVVVAVALGLAFGLASPLGIVRLAGWAVFAACASISAEFIVGLSAMHAGWFPAFATALIFLLVGQSLGYPPEAVAALVGLVASGGPAFADAGYDLKAGWHLRRLTGESAIELEGRRQQLIAGALGLLVALVMVIFFHNRYFGAGRFPPIDRVFAATIQAGIEPSLVSRLAWWAIPGAILQWAGGSARQLGVLFGTGLLIGNAAAGWAVLAGLAVRGALRTTARRAADLEDADLAVLGAGTIAGDALWGFAASLARVLAFGSG